MPDARALADVAHSVGALAWMDCVHYAPHRRIDVKALGADVLLCSPYKFFGPHQGLGFAREELLESWPADRVRPAGQTPAGHRFETGTKSHEALAGVDAAIDFIASLGEGADRRAKLDDAYREIIAYETALTAKMLDRLAESRHDALRHHGSRARGRAHADVHVTLPGITPREVCEQLAEADPRLGRQLLRPRHHGSPRPRGPRRRDPPRLPALHDARKRSIARSRPSPRSPAAEPRLECRAMLLRPADVAELVDAHGSGPCGRKVVEVQVLSSACRSPCDATSYSRQGQSQGHRHRGPVGLAAGRVGVYVDGFNLYYGGRSLCGRGQAGWRWLDVRALRERLLTPDWRTSGAYIERVVYCTARISRSSNPASQAEQDVYLKALVGTKAVDHVEMACLSSA